MLERKDNKPQCGKKSVRHRSIDIFRGITIVLMVFFTILSRLAYVPESLDHNEFGKIHLGDFVLTMFLFVSGMSIVFFREKRKNRKTGEYVLDVIERLGMLVMIAIVLSPFSAGEILGMDEVMLNAVLFIPALILIIFPEWSVFLVAGSVFAAYFILGSVSMLPDFRAHYLGGYAAAIFYLPVMLGGAMAGKRLVEGKNLDMLLALWAVTSLVLLLVIPAYKMTASPSFMAVSVALSLAFFYIIREAEAAGKLAGRISEKIEYLGRKPIRYWTLMFVLLVGPLTVYMAYMDSRFPIGMDWLAAVAVSLLCVPLLYISSKGVDILEDLVKARLKKFRA